MPCSPRMSTCHVGCLHRASVMAYRIERHRQELIAEAESYGYETELIEYLANHPIITFKDWLKGHKRT